MTDDRDTSGTPSSAENGRREPPPLASERRVPQFGEYATPEEQRARIQDPAAYDAALAPPAASETEFPAPDERQRVDGAPPQTRTWDRILTIAMLAYGVFAVLTTIPQILDYSTFADTFLRMSGIDAEFTNVESGRLWAGVAAVTFGGGFAITVIFAAKRLTRGKSAWWIPILGAVVTFLAVSIMLSIPLVSDPAIRAGIGA